MEIEWFRSREEGRIVIETWRRHYDAVRPHSSLSYLCPAAVQFLLNAFSLPFLLSAFNLRKVCFGHTSVLSNMMRKTANCSHSECFLKADGHRSLWG